LSFFFLPVINNTKLSVTVNLSALFMACASPICSTHAWSWAIIERASSSYMYQFESLNLKGLICGRCNLWSRVLLFPYLFLRGKENYGIVKRSEVLSLCWRLFLIVIRIFEL